MNTKIKTVDYLNRYNSLTQFYYFPGRKYTPMIQVFGSQVLNCNAPQIQNSERTSPLEERSLAKYAATCRQPRGFSFSLQQNILYAFFHFGHVAISSLSSSFSSARFSSRIPVFKSMLRQCMIEVLKYTLYDTKHSNTIGTAR